MVRRRRGCRRRVTRTGRGQRAAADAVTLVGVGERITSRGDE